LSVKGQKRHLLNFLETKAITGNLMFKRRLWRLWK